jgi:hypothetical protein
MYTRVTDSLNDNSILSEEQFGFTRGFSTDKALHKFTDEILCALNEKHILEEECVALLKHLIV